VNDTSGNILCGMSGDWGDCAVVFLFEIIGAFIMIPHHALILIKQYITTCKYDFNTIKNFNDIKKMLSVEIKGLYWIL
jgi:hypothetical protein